MAKRLVLLAAALSFVFGANDALAKGAEPVPDTKVMEFGTHRLLYDPPQSYLDGLQRGGVDTTWFGNIDGSGVAVRTGGGVSYDDAVAAGGTWDFEDGTLQGWTSKDLTDIPIYYELVTHSSFADDPEDCVINGNWSIWCGRHELDTQADCWPGGQGYSNGWGQHAIKEFNYVGGGSEATISFDYYVDSEVGFDFTYIYVTNNPNPLNTSVAPNADGWGYSGSIDDTPANQNIGSPSNPASETIVIPAGTLSGLGTFEIDMNVDSDPLFSDGLDSFSGFLNSAFGPFGFDDFRMRQTGVDVTDTFESGTQEGWVFSSDAPAGAFIQVADISTLGPIADDCACPLQDAGNDFVMIAADLTPGQFPHPKKQREELRSNPAYVGMAADANRSDRFVLWSSYDDLISLNGAGYRVSTHYYPWECNVTNTIGWTLEPAGPGGFNFSDPPDCGTFVVNVSGDVPPAGLDSMKVIFEMLADCDDFGTPPEDCTGPDNTNTTPWLDNVALGLGGLAVNAPNLNIDLTFQDVYPQGNTLFANATADIHSYYDNNRADTDPTNATMGDSVVVLTGNASNIFVYLNFRVSAGPQIPGSTWLTQYNAASSGPGDFVRVRMDTVQIQNIAQPGRYCSYVHETVAGSGSEMPYSGPLNDDTNGATTVFNPANKIIEDNVLTPGTLVEYFFSSSFGSAVSNPTATFPDTTPAGPGEDPFYLEFEVLPGFFDSDPGGGVTILGPCALYVDAYNVGAQVPIEDRGLRPYLGTTTGQGGRVHDNWDRYDYSAASSNVPAPMAREAAGDNGMSKYQSLIYTTILYNTGTFSQEGLRDGDARLLQTWLESLSFNRDVLNKGLWLTGNGMAEILYRSGRADAAQLAAAYAGVQLPNNAPYRDIATGGPDPSFCVRLDEAGGSDFPGDGAGFAYSALRGNGCPTQLDFQIVTTIGPGTGNQVYVDQDNGESITQFASISNDQMDASAGTPNYRVLLDAYSVHYLRTYPDGGTTDGESVCIDSAAIGARVEDVFDWFATTGPLCNPVPLQIDTPEQGGQGLSARTRLLQNAPNPFNPTTTVRYELAEQSHVKVQVFDVSGKLVRTLVDAVQAPEAYNIQWDGSNAAGTQVSSGVYWVRMSTSAGFKASTKMVVLK